MKLANLFSLVLVLVTALEGCRSAGSIEREAEQLRQQVENTGVGIAASSPRTITWRDAVELARRKNPAIMAASITCEAARRELRNRWKELLPKLDLRLGYFESLASASTGGWSYVIASQLNLPNFARYSYERLGAVLAVRRAELTLTITERQVLIELYQLFCEDAWLRQEADLLALTSELAKVTARDSAQGGIAALRELIACEDRRRQWQLKLSDLLGEHVTRWAVSKLDFPANPLERKSEAEKIAHSAEALGTALALVEWEGACLRSNGVKLRYWPSLYTYLSTPNLYEAQSASRETFAVGQASVGAEIVWQVANLWEAPVQVWLAGHEEAMLREKLWQQHWRRLQQTQNWRKALREREAEKRLLDEQILIWSGGPQFSAVEIVRNRQERLLGLVSARIQCERSLLAVRLALCDSVEELQLDAPKTEG